MGRTRDIKKGRPSGKHRLEDDLFFFFFFSFLTPDRPIARSGERVDRSRLLFVSFRCQDSTLFFGGFFTCILSQSWDLSFSLIAIF